MNSLQRSVFEAASKLAKNEQEKKELERECAQLSNTECWTAIAQLNRARSK